MYALCSDFKFRKKLNTFANFLLVATGSERQRSGSVIFSQLQRHHCFNCIALPAADPVKGIGFLFLAQNFTFSIELQVLLLLEALDLFISKVQNVLNCTPFGFQECFVAVMATLSSIRIDAQSDDCRSRVLQRLCSASSLQQIVKLSAQTLFLYDLSLTAVDYSMVARYRLEMTSFCAVLWETLLLLCAAAQDTHLALACREKLVAEFARRLEVLCSPAEVGAFKRVVDVTGESIPGKVNKAIVKAANTLGYVSNRHFVSKCAVLWSLMADPAASAVVIAGAASEGKSAVRDTVLKAFEVLGHIGTSMYVDSWVVRCRRAGMLIVETVENWISERKMRAKRNAKLEKTFLFKSLNSAAAKGNVSRTNRSSPRAAPRPSAPPADSKPSGSPSELTVKKYSFYHTSLPLK